MLYVYRTLVLCGLCLLAGCAPIFSAEPLGEAVAVLKPEEWNGVWVDQFGGLSRVLVVDSAGGKLLLSRDWQSCSPERNPSPGDELWLLRQSESWYFGNPAVKNVLYPIWGALRRDGEAMYGCLVDEERLRELVVSGALPGVHLRRRSSGLAAITRPVPGASVR